jgi:hypothetical protein
LLRSSKRSHENVSGSQLHEEFAEHLVCKTARHERNVDEIDDDALARAHLGQIRQFVPYWPARGSASERSALILKNEEHFRSVVLFIVQLDEVGRRVGAPTEFQRFV